ncbi:MAG: tetratricopeptide repeat protein [Acidobacteria bacterium]|nr:tetratricopeptide repeat protein [Acidobacteriota bacterium]
MRRLLTLAALFALVGPAPAQVKRRGRPAPPPAARKFVERPAPPVSAEARREMEARLAEARAAYERDPRDADAIIWLGRRTAYLGRFGESIRIYTRGLRLHPRDARFLRHRGHRLITLRRFREAAADLSLAARLVRGKPDEVEPDGIPNERNTPTSTLHSNVWYHLGLAHYLRGDFPAALRAYRECLKVSTNPDMLVATSHWLYMTLRRAGRDREAARLLEPITADMDIIENRDYLRLLLMYKGALTPAALLEETARAGTQLGNTTVGYGVGNWRLYHGRRGEAAALLRRVTASPQWTSFGYIAAEADLGRLGARAR